MKGRLANTLYGFMEGVIEFFIEWGYVGIFLSAFLAGSILPFSSELVVVALVQAGLSPLWCVVWATAGNTLGGLTCYLIGRLGKTEWIERYLRISREHLDRAERFMKGKGAFMALFVALPYIGDAIAVVLGLMRSNIWITTSAMAVGKGLRYVALLYAAEGLISLF